MPELAVPLAVPFACSLSSVRSFHPKCAELRAARTVDVVDAEDEYSSSSERSNRSSRIRQQRRRRRSSRPLEAPKEKTEVKASKGEDAKTKQSIKRGSSEKPRPAAATPVGTVPAGLKAGPGVALLLAEKRLTRGSNLESPCPAMVGQDLPPDAQSQMAQYAAELQRVSSELATAQQMLHSNRQEAAVIKTTLENQQAALQSYQAAEAAEKAIRDRDAKLKAEKESKHDAEMNDGNRPRRKLSRSRSPPSRSSASTSSTRSSRNFEIDCSPAPLGTARLLEKPPPPVPRRATHVDDNGNFLVPLDKSQGRGPQRANRGGKGRGRGRGRQAWGWWW